MPSARSATIVIVLSAFVIGSCLNFGEIVPWQLPHNLSIEAQTPLDITRGQMSIGTAGSGSKQNYSRQCSQWQSSGNQYQLNDVSNLPPFSGRRCSSPILNRKSNALPSIPSRTLTVVLPKRKDQRSATSCEQGARKLFASVSDAGLCGTTNIFAATQALQLGAESMESTSNGTVDATLDLLIASVAQITSLAGIYGNASLECEDATRDRARSVVTSTRTECCLRETNNISQVEIQALDTERCGASADAGVELLFKGDAKAGTGNTIRKVVVLITIICGDIISWLISQTRIPQMLEGGFNLDAKFLCLSFLVVFLTPSCRYIRQLEHGLAETSEDHIVIPEDTAEPDEHTGSSIRVRSIGGSFLDVRFGGKESIGDLRNRVKSLLTKSHGGIEFVLGSIILPQDTTCAELLESYPCPLEIVCIVNLKSQRVTMDGFVFSFAGQVVTHLDQHRGSDDNIIGYTLSLRDGTVRNHHPTRGLDAFFAAHSHKQVVQCS